LVFFVLVVTLVPLAVGADVALLQSIGPGTIWLGALLASLLAQESLFRSDFEDGSLEQLLLSPYPLPLLVLAKISAHWIVTSVPLIVVAPLLGVLLRLPAGGTGALLLTLLLGTPVLSLIGAIGVALTVGLQKGGVMLSLLILPLYVPVLIVATLAVDAALGGLPISAHLYFLGALLVGALTLAPLAGAAALRISVG
jgi:heme exporter protein B